MCRQRMVVDLKDPTDSTIPEEAVVGVEKKVAESVVVVRTAAAAVDTVEVDTVEVEEVALVEVATYWHLDMRSSGLKKSFSLANWAHLNRSF